MKLQEQTLKVLKNFSTINPSIVINAGNVVRTMSPNSTVLAKAVLDDSFEKELSIYDLSRLISSISLLENAEIDLQENFLDIVNDTSKIRYFYADPTLIKKPKNSDIKLPSEDIQFSLENSVLNNVLKAISVLGLSDLGVVGENGSLYLKGIDSSGKNKDMYSVKIGDSNKNFTVIFKLENLKLLPQDYNVTVCFAEQGIISYFKGTNIEYWIAVDSNSKIEK